MVYCVQMQNLEPIKTANISKHAYGAIEEAIVRCDFKPGALLSDRQLSQALGVSRTPVRDALQALEASGLVKRRGRIGWMVAGFDQRDVHELYELRRVLEPLGLKRLSITWEAVTIEELAGFFNDFPGRLSREHYDDYMERDHDFHKRIVEWSGNMRVVQFYGVIEKQINRIRHYLAPGYKGRMKDIAEEHRRICEAIAARDLSAATSALLDHLHAGEEAMFNFLRKQQFEDAPGAEGSTHDSHEVGGRREIAG